MGKTGLNLPGQETKPPREEKTAKRVIREKLYSKKKKSNVKSSTTRKKTR
jgi:hypothetical protein